METSAKGPGSVKVKPPAFQRHLVPKTPFGKRLLFPAKLCFRADFSRHPNDVGMELPRQLRSQMEFGNEDGLRFTLTGARCNLSSGASSEAFQQQPSGDDPSVVAAVYDRRRRAKPPSLRGDGHRPPLQLHPRSEIAGYRERPEQASRNRPAEIKSFTSASGLGRRRHWRRPKPLELLKARVGAISTGWVRIGTPAQARSSWLILAETGRNPSHNARVVKAASMAPARQMPWPVNAFVLLT